MRTIPSEIISVAPGLHGLHFNTTADFEVPTLTMKMTEHRCGSAFAIKDLVRKASDYAVLPGV